MELMELMDPDQWGTGGGYDGDAGDGDNARSIRPPWDDDDDGGDDGDGDEKQGADSPDENINALKLVHQGRGYWRRKASLVNPTHLTRKNGIFKAMCATTAALLQLPEGRQVHDVYLEMLHDLESGDFSKGQQYATRLDAIIAYEPLQKTLNVPAAASHCSRFLNASTPYLMAESGRWKHHLKARGPVFFGWSALQLWSAMCDRKQVPQFTNIDLDDSKGTIKNDFFEFFMDTVHPQVMTDNSRDLKKCRKWLRKDADAKARDWFNTLEEAFFRAFSSLNYKMQPILYGYDSSIQNKRDRSFVKEQENQCWVEMTDTLFIKGLLLFPLCLCSLHIHSVLTQSTLPTAHSLKTHFCS